MFKNLSLKNKKRDEAVFQSKYLKIFQFKVNKSLLSARKSQLIQAKFLIAQVL